MPNLGRLENKNPQNMSYDLLKKKETSIPDIFLTSRGIYGEKKH